MLKAAPPHTPPTHTKITTWDDGYVNFCGNLFVIYIYIIYIKSSHYTPLIYKNVVCQLSLNKTGKELLKNTEKKTPLGTEFLNKCIIHKRKNL